MIRNSTREGLGKLSHEEKRTAVRNVLARAPMSMSQVNKLFFFDEDQPYIRAALLDFQKTALKNVSQEVQAKLFSIVESKVKGRGPGESRGLIQFTLFLFIKGERYWKLNAKKQVGLSAAASMVAWDGASLLKGHDTQASPEDVGIAHECIKELADWFHGPYAVMLMKAYQKAMKKQLPGFTDMLTKVLPPGSKNDARSAASLFNKLMLTRLYLGNIVGLEYGSAAVTIIGKVMFQR